MTTRTARATHTAGATKTARATAAPLPAAQAPLGDLRFRALLGAERWSSLAPAIRARFSKRLADGRTAVYAGMITETFMSRSGWLLAQATRLFGAPLPLSCEAGVPATVTVTEDPAGGGQFWTRIYGRRRGFPQVIHSAKRFRGPTGLEEYLGRGLGMALTVHGEANALHFRSDHYFIELFSRRLRLPRFLSPGDTTVSHIDRGGGRFTFALEVRHPRFGVLVRQTGLFRDLVGRNSHPETASPASPASHPLPNPSPHGTATPPRSHPSKGEGLDRAACTHKAPLPRAGASRTCMHTIDNHQYARGWGGG